MADHERLILDATGVVCPTCRAEVGERCVYGAGPRVGQVRDGSHSKRKEAARKTVGLSWVPVVGTSKSGCSCTNHLGQPKQAHRSRQSAVSWAASNWVRKRGIGGMRFEVYRCPTSDRWHIRTARATTTTGRTHG